MIFILYVAFCIPLRIGFDLQVQPGNAWFIMDIIADVCFVLDLIFNFRTGFSDGFNVMQSDGRSMVKNCKHRNTQATSCCSSDSRRLSDRLFVATDIGWPIDDPLCGSTEKELRAMAEKKPHGRAKLQRVVSSQPICHWPVILRELF
jgi:hypothetical protein